MELGRSYSALYSVPEILLMPVRFPQLNRGCRDLSRTIGTSKLEEIATKSVAIVPDRILTFQTFDITHITADTLVDFVSNALLKMAHALW